MTEQITDKIMKIAGVRFRENWKVYDFDASDVDVTVGDKVIVDSERGSGFAYVVRIRRSQVSGSAEPPAPAPPAPEIPEGVEFDIDEAEGKGSPEGQPRGQGPRTVRKILRKATDDDIAREEKNREREAEAFAMAQDMITERELPMKLIRVEYSFDASRAIFFFFSETRVDFRELVKELAYKLKSRIEMRQIGVRDVARMIGGFGPCGRELCCSSFLKNFEPVSIRMAKKQEMVLNPAKISGVCGRLLCCLSYEYEMYDEIKKDVADLREAAVKLKKEDEERRIAEERRLADEKKRQEERKQQQELRKEKPKEAVQKGGTKPEKRRDAQQEKKVQPQAEQLRERQLQQKPEKQQEMKPPQQDGEKQVRKKKRRFWRKKKRQGQGENKPEGSGGGQAP